LCQAFTLCCNAIQPLAERLQTLFDLLSHLSQQLFLLRHPANPHLVVLRVISLLFFIVAHQNRYCWCECTEFETIEMVAVGLGEGGREGELAGMAKGWEEVAEQDGLR
jgi:hypothetical protein